MDKRIMKLVVITSIIIALLRMKLKLFMYSKCHGIKNHHHNHKMVHELKKPTITSVSRVVNVVENE